MPYIINRNLGFKNNSGIGLKMQKFPVKKPFWKLILNFRRGELLVNISPKRIREKGQGLVEYALILLLVAIVIISVLVLLGPQVGSLFSSVNKGIS